MNNYDQFKICKPPRTCLPGQDIIITIICPDNNIKYYCRWTSDGKITEPSDCKQEGRQFRCCLTGSMLHGSHTLTCTCYHKERKDSKKEVVDYETDIIYEVCENPTSDSVLESLDGINSGLRHIAEKTGSTFGGDGEGVVKMQHQKSVGIETENQGFYLSIRLGCKRVGFEQYNKFLKSVFENNNESGSNGENSITPSNDNMQSQPILLGLKNLPNPLHGVDAYKQLKTATQMFLLLECGVKIDNIGVDGEVLLNSDDERRRAPNVNNDNNDHIDVMKEKLKSYLGQTERLPYIDRIIDTVFQDHEPTVSPYYGGILTSAVDCPCLLELIWSYWHEECGLVQTLNAISQRFQNKRRAGGRDPLAQLEIAPLRPLNNLLWGYVQDERERLSIARRASEYQHQYGFTLLGKGVPKLRPADNRSKFIEAFHTLLFRSWTYYQEVADTHVVPDGFPLLNSLKEVHMLLAEGAHNQFGDLPWTSRAEMLIQQWLLARPEMQDFLRGRAMVPYKEPWMGPADTMKKLQGWTDVPVTHFRDLGVFGEQLLLSVRYDDWIDDTKTEDDAKNWANYWKQEAQGYIHSYRAATGADLTNAASARERIDTKMPAVHLRERERQQARPI